MARDEFKWPRGGWALPRLREILDRGRPRIGVTQGGSSRKNSGARVAATSVPSSRLKKEST